MSTLVFSLQIEGMSCSSCSNTVQLAVEALGSNSNKVSCSVSLSTNMATVEVVETAVDSSSAEVLSSVSAVKVVQAIEDVGFGALLLDSKQYMKATAASTTSSSSNSNSNSSSTHKSSTSSVPLSSAHIQTKVAVTVALDGMTCSSCSSTIQNLLNGLSGVSEANVSLTTNSGTFFIEESVISIDAVKNEIEDIGFGCEVLFRTTSQLVPVGDPGHQRSESSSLMSASLSSSSSSSSSSSVYQDANLSSTASSKAVVEASQYLVTVTAIDNNLLTEDLSRRFMDQLSGLVGVVDVSFIEKNGSMKLTPVVSSPSHYLRLSCNIEIFGPRDAMRAAKDFGLKLEVGLLGGFSMASRLAQQYEDETRSHRNTAILSWLFTLPILVITMILPTFAAANKWLDILIFPGFNVNACLLVILSFPVQWVVGMRFHMKAFKSVINKSSTLGMDFLISTGTCAAYLYSFVGLIGDIYHGVANNADVEYFETSAVLISVVVLGKYLETFAKGQTASAIHKLTSYRANKARLITEERIYRQAWTLTVTSSKTSSSSSYSPNLALETKLEKLRSLHELSHFFCNKTNADGDNDDIVENDSRDSLKSKSRFSTKTDDFADPSDKISNINNINNNSNSSHISYFSRFTNLFSSTVPYQNNYQILPSDSLSHSHESSKIVSINSSAYNKSSSFSSSNGGENAGINESDDVLVDAVWLQQFDCLRLVAGENVPADGVIVSGFASIDEAMMTGESLPVSRHAGEKVFAGTTVIDGSAVLLVLACGDGSTLGKIVSTVQSAQASKPPIQELADKIARKFVPIVTFLSLITFCVWISAYLLGFVPKRWYTPSSSIDMGGNSNSNSNSNLNIDTEKDMNMGMSANSLANQCQGNPYLMSFLFALSVWVSACPCAFGLATPTVILVATGIAASFGILIRRGASIQYSAEIDSIAFDKTGTLTLGKPEVSDFFFVDFKGATWRVPLSDAALIRRLLGQCNINATSSGQFSLIDLGFILKCLDKAEAQSSHPLASGIKDYCKAMLRGCTEVGLGTCATKSGKSDDNFLDNPLSTILSNVFSADDEGTIVTEPGQGLRVSFKLSREQLLKYASKSAIFMSILNESLSEDETQYLPLTALVGSAHLLLNNGVMFPSSATTVATGLRAGGKVTVFLALNKHVVACSAVADSIRPEAPAIVAELQNSMGIKCYMITGDERVTALAIAAAVGIPPERVFAKASPEDKENFIKALQYHYSGGGEILSRVGTKERVEAAKSGKVMFIGDGTNDAMAMAAADVSIAMSGGTDIAIESGDVVFCKTTNTLESLPVLLDLCRKSLRRILINYFWALGYNALLIPMAAGVLYPSYQFSLQPMLAGTAMAASSVSIVINSLLLKLYKPNISLEDNFKQSTIKKVGEASSKSCNCPASSAPQILRSSSMYDRIMFYLNYYTSASSSGTTGDVSPYDIELANFASSRSISGRRMIFDGDSTDPMGIYNILFKFDRGLDRFTLYNSDSSDNSHNRGQNPILHKGGVGRGRGGEIGGEVVTKQGCQCGAGNCMCGSNCMCGMQVVNN